MQKADRDLEAQVDALLVALFNERREFVEWFCGRLNHKKPVIPQFDTASASRSPSRRCARGQTDVGLELAGKQRCCVLIENKVRHHFEDEQPERYREECSGLVTGKFFDVAVSVLVAPKRYITSIGAAITKFDGHVTYEEINDRLGGNPLLLKAIRHCETGWIAESIPAVSANFEGYAELVKRAYPELRLITKAGNNPTQSRTAQFDSGFAVDIPDGVPYVWLLHQWQEGRAKLLFKGWGEHRSVLGPLIATDVAADSMTLDPNKSKSLGMMVRTPVINNHGKFGDQVDAFVAGLDAVRGLREWYLANTPKVTKWVARAGALVRV